MVCCVQLPFRLSTARIWDCWPVFPSTKNRCPNGWTVMDAAVKVAGRSRSGMALESPTCQLTTWLPALSLVRMTASAPVGHTSKSTTEVPAGRLNSELDEGEGVTLSSAVVKSEDACAAEGA